MEWTKFGKIYVITMIILTVLVIGYFCGVGIILGNHPAAIHFCIMDILLLVWIFTGIGGGAFVVIRNIIQSR